jgi:5-methylcytosine-specific restriction endonuclease McrA
MIDLTGQIFGDLTALEATSERRHGNVVWVCVCVCGNPVKVDANKLRFHTTQSCGCRLSRVLTVRNIARTKHGHARTNSQSATYKAWQCMIARCEDPKHTNYKYYGGRGIKVDPRWRLSFESFLEDMGERPTGLTLDRKDPCLDYGPSNCRWATDADQARNRRSTHWITFNGETLTLAEWCRRLGCKRSALQMRFSKGWSVTRALTEPFEARRPRDWTNPVPLEVRKAKSSFRQQYRHLYRSTGDDLTFEQWLGVLAQYGGRCFYCGSPDPRTMDHVIPTSKGGLHTVSNVVPACRSCNSKKGVSMPPTVRV